MARFGLDGAGQPVKKLYTDIRAEAQAGWDRVIDRRAGGHFILGFSVDLSRACAGVCLSNYSRG